MRTTQVAHVRVAAPRRLSARENELIRLLPLWFDPDHFIHTRDTAAVHEIHVQLALDDRDALDAATEEPQIQVRTPVNLEVMLARTQRFFIHTRPRSHPLLPPFDLVVVVHLRIVGRDVLAVLTEYLKNSEIREART
jgi:hypothetical protein